MLDSVMQDRASNFEPALKYSNQDQLAKYYTVRVLVRNRVLLMLLVMWREIYLVLEVMLRYCGSHDFCCNTCPTLHLIVLR